MRSPPTSPTPPGMSAWATWCASPPGGRYEECFQAAKSECGPDHYEVRRYVGWHRHITLAMLTHALLAPTTSQKREKGGLYR
ncbi:hypothetical protein GCM10009799_32910 [Nocardiopsis rhodophaea]|uniref:Transposase n=1 Tax=Nocardiopsis rhodophaea TaxID=280238 RepID=A0ABP5ET96_9ACTN